MYEPVRHLRFFSVAAREKHVLVLGRGTRQLIARDGHQQGKLRAPDPLAGLLLLRVLCRARESPLLLHDGARVCLGAENSRLLFRMP